MTSEKELEDLLFYHPYLIAPELDRMPRRRQVATGHDRADLLFDLPDGICIVELKICTLTPDCIRQLIRYCEDFSRKQTLGPRHYLVGLKPVNEDQVLREAAHSGFRIILRYLGEHIPTELVFDEASRKYVPFSEDLKYTLFKRLRF